MGMPTSEPVRDMRRATYSEALSAFAAQHAVSPGPFAAVRAYHAVRNIPYGSGPDRTPRTALEVGRGACTAKHLILRDLLRQLGLTADVELVDCDFAAGVPPVPSMPEPLRQTAQDGGIRDVHCWVRLRGTDDALRLDATWPDTLSAYGFPVNSGWDGTGDTQPAAPDGVVLATADDVLAAKERLLSNLTDEEATARKEFLRQLTAWLMDLPKEHGGRKL